MIVSTSYFQAEFGIVFHKAGDKYGSDEYKTASWYQTARLYLQVRAP